MGVGQHQQVQALNAMSAEPAGNMLTSLTGAAIHHGRFTAWSTEQQAVTVADVDHVQTQSAINAGFGSGVHVASGHRRPVNSTAAGEQTEQREEEQRDEAVAPRFHSIYPSARYSSLRRSSNPELSSVTIPPAASRWS